MREMSGDNEREEGHEGMKEESASGRESIM